MENILMLNSKLKSNSMLIAAIKGLRLHRYVYIFIKVLYIHRYIIFIKYIIIYI